MGNVNACQSAGAEIIRASSYVLVSLFLKIKRMKVHTTLPSLSIPRRVAGNILLLLVSLLVALLSEHLVEETELGRCNREEEHKAREGEHS